MYFFSWILVSGHSQDLILVYDMGGCGFDAAVFFCLLVLGQPDLDTAPVFTAFYFAEVRKGSKAVFDICESRFHSQYTKIMQ